MTRPEADPGWSEAQAYRAELFVLSAATQLAAAAERALSRSRIAARRAQHNALQRQVNEATRDSP